MFVLVLTDGKAGDSGPCLGVAEAVIARTGGWIADRTIKPRAFFAWAMPWGPSDPRDNAAIAPPYPDIAIASGRRAVASLRTLKKRSPKTFTVFLKDPRSSASGADLIWVPEHDALRGETVIVSLTAPHRLTPEKLRESGKHTRPSLLALPSPRIAVLLGGPSKDVRFGKPDRIRLIDALQELQRQGASLMITPSRRTPADFMQLLHQEMRGPNLWIWDGSGVNPYLEMFALAEAFVTTGESTNMVGEAAMTGRPIGVFRPFGLPSKIGRYLEALERHGAVTIPAKCLEMPPYEPLNSTPGIANDIVRRYQLFINTQKG